MRIVLTVLVAAGLLTVGGVPSASPAGAEPGDTCPPACDRIPASAWITPSAIPLDPRFDWPQLSQLAVAAPAPRFRFEELCASPSTVGDPRTYAVAERATVVRSEGQWQLQAQIVHWRGETWRGGQLVQESFAAAVAALRNCQSTNPTASPSLTLDEPLRIAAAVSGPMVLHEYLLADPVSSTITELSLWTAGPSASPWPAVSDAAVLDALGLPLCTAYIGSCP